MMQIHMRSTYLANLGRASHGRLSRLLVSAVGFCVAVCGVTIGAAAGTADAATHRVSWTRISTSFATSYATYSFSYDLPSVSGVSRTVAAAVKKSLSSFFINAIDTMTTHDASLSSSEIATCRTGGDNAALLDEQRSSDSVAAVFKNRYLSVHVAWYSASCNTPMGISAQKYLNIDLKTGKRVNLAKFVDDRKGVFAAEIGAAMARSPLRDPDGLFRDVHGRNTIAEWRDFDGWAATNSGVWVYFTWEGAVEPYLIKWERILKPGAVKGRTILSTARYGCSGTTYHLRVTVHGSLVGISTPDGAIEYGVRGTSRTILLHSSSGSWVSLGKLTFTSTTSRKASSYVSLSYC